MVYTPTSLADESNATSISSSGVKLYTLILSTSEVLISVTSSPNFTLVAAEASNGDTVMSAPLTLHVSDIPITLATTLYLPDFVSLFAK